MCALYRKHAKYAVKLDNILNCGAHYALYDKTECTEKQRCRRPVMEKGLIK